MTNQNPSNQPPPNPNQPPPRKPTAIEQASDWAAKAGPLGDILYAIAQVLPTSLGNPLRQLANTLRRTDHAARRIKQANERMNKEQ